MSWPSGKLEPPVSGCHEFESYHLVGEKDFFFLEQ